MDLAGVIEDAFRDGCFAGVDMGGNSNVPNFGDIASPKYLKLPAKVPAKQLTSV
jgi:hypothetical protein